MFEKKQIIYSETQGVCQVENIVSLSASRRERKIPYSSQISSARAG